MDEKGEKRIRGTTSYLDTKLMKCEDQFSLQIAWTRRWSPTNGDPKVMHRGVVRLVPGFQDWLRSHRVAMIAIDPPIEWPGLKQEAHPKIGLARIGPRPRPNFGQVPERHGPGSARPSLVLPGQG
ncbi:hypothetical protein AMTR_s00226p00007010 [Amborella trichopoda]|uniref:Uncharacterized protein n=1 Tax=Amborella trichopoda TaxID=13333 RepID=W1NUL5_AMBTC|nr:hypothetical protein AMTR_s00226p00007010 [Amborella trichopoda]